ncbi:hypothetical protein DXG03_003959, partial [Asterophora parasitica]
MSMPSLFLLPTTDKFDGSNWIEWKTTIVNAAKAKGLMGYLKGKIKKPLPPNPSKPAPATSYWGSVSPTFEEWEQHDTYAQGMITLNIINPIRQGVRMDRTLAECWHSLCDTHDAQTDLGLIAAKEMLTSIKYTEGTDMEKHIAEMHEAWSKANNQGTAITDHKFCTYLLRSMPVLWSIL